MLDYIDYLLILKTKISVCNAVKLSEYPNFQYTKIKCRLVKVFLENGETEILCTSLIDQVDFKHEVFKELYAFRWNDE